LKDTLEKVAIYLLKAVVKALGLREGGKVILKVSGTSLILEPSRSNSASAFRQEVRVYNA
jgi:antitoxin component of MazEF toxin-antitoxin module